MSDYPYVPARLQWPRSVKPSLIVIHTMEAAETHTTAESCARYFQSASAGGSAHLCIDDNSVVQCVPWANKAAGARGYPYRGKTVNDYAIHFEHAGYARQTKAEWEDQFSVLMLFWSAIAAAKVCKQFGIPPVTLVPDQVRAGATGITTHAAVTTAFKVSGGHWDPGPAFPMPSYIANVAYWLKQL